MPLQFGVQVEPHCPAALHDCPVGQVPQEPPQPSLPHCFPVQLGVHPSEVNRSLRSVAFAASPRNGVTPKISCTVRSVELWV